MPARGVTGPIVALTGTPGTGKTSIAEGLRALGFAVLDLKRYVGDERFDLGSDADHHHAVELDDEALGDFLSDHLVDEIGAAAQGPVFIESHFAHELACVDRVIILRCRPSILKQRLAGRDWPVAKVQENLEAEGLDLILQEAVMHRDEREGSAAPLALGELDTTTQSVPECVDAVVALANTAPMNLEIGTVDWADEVLGWY